MQLVRGLYNLPRPVAGTAATIGNFDGIHLGHRQILAQLAAKAGALGLASAVMTFEPQPREFFSPEEVVPRLTRLREKYLHIRDQGIDRLACLRFDARLASFSPQEFIRELLVDGLGLRYLFIGDDFRFGKGRQGDFDLLQEAGREYGFEVEQTPTFMLDGERVSSTRVRQALSDGDLELARRLLGRSYSMSGRVAHGDKRGRQIGFPTANIFLHRRSTPVQGVYAVRMHGIAEGGLPGVANVGTRPTVDGTASLLEVHLFDFDADIYNRYIEVEFDRKLRAERRFDSFEELRQQIVIDAGQAREFFELPPA